VKKLYAILFAALFVCALSLPAMAAQEEVDRSAYAREKIAAIAGEIAPAAARAAEEIAPIVNAAAEEIVSIVVAASEEIVPIIAYAAAADTDAPNTEDNTEGNTEGNAEGDPDTDLEPIRVPVVDDIKGLKFREALKVIKEGYRSGKYTVRDILRTPFLLLRPVRPL